MRPAPVRWMVLVAAAGLTLAACASGTGNDNSGDNDSPDDSAVEGSSAFDPDAELSGDLTIMGFALGDEIAQIRYDDAVAAIDPVDVSLAEGELDIQQFLSAMATGEPPDLIRPNRDQIGTFASRGAIMPLNECVDGEGIDVSMYREAAVEQVRSTHPQVDVVATTDELIGAGIDIYSPCALGGALSDDSSAALAKHGVQAVCGGANNQLEHPGVEKVLEDAGILYAPDYVVNSGGVIQVADELHGFSFDRAKAKAARIFDTTRKIFTLAGDEGVPPAVAADRIAERRIAEISRLHGIYLQK
jgi:hypothetical protein